MRSGKLVIAQGGGLTTVINQSLVGAVLEAQLLPQIDQIYGAYYGYLALWTRISSTFRPKADLIYRDQHDELIPVSR